MFGTWAGIVRRDLHDFEGMNKLMISDVAN